MTKLEILTGSHFSNKKHNLNLSEEINDILLSKKNPLSKKFNEEQLFLDDTDGFISVVKSSYIFKEMTNKQVIKLKEYLLQYIEPFDGFLCVGGSMVRFN
tara:strand:+ start:177 stop:476 length:300 start_codon:yes stop_codon:yes gene_type:complete